MAAHDIVMAAAGGSTAANYIEDVFSTYLYTGDDGSNRAITNGIDLAGKGGMVWIKSRSAAFDNIVQDTAQGITNSLRSNTTAASASSAYNVKTADSTGFTIGLAGIVNSIGGNYASWTFRKQPKFFDVVTYTGDGTAGRTVAHSLGSTPGCIIIKKTNGAREWAVYHRSLGATKAIYLNTTAAAYDDTTGIYWNSTAPTSTQFSVGTSSSTNLSGDTYVAYIYAHDAGGFGLTGTDNVISCGSYTTDGRGNATVSLGYEPQWVMIKNSSSAGYPWYMFDNMRGMYAGGLSGAADRMLQANTADAEADNAIIDPTATGFTINNTAPSNTYIYIAIRRGPMKVPTDATKVFKPVAQTANSNPNIVTNFPVDATLFASRTAPSGGLPFFIDRLRGTTTSASRWLATSGTAAETAFSSGGYGYDNNTGYLDNLSVTIGEGTPAAYWNLQRASSFFDVVCYTGNSTDNRALNHNLTVTPELIIYKRRNVAADWVVMSTMFPNASDALFLQSTGALVSNAYSSVPRPTSTYFYVGDWGALNNSGDTYVAYLFASCPGVSKVGSYSGTGATQTISCGFTGGARWVLIKRTDSTGDWYVWDTARGMVSGTDPSLLLNSTAAEVNANSVYTTTGGFQIVSTAAGINASGGTYIYLAIA